MFQVGLIVTIFEQTGSAFQSVGVMIATTLPPFLLGPFAGVFADRYPRKWVMATMDLLRAALVGLAFLFVGDQNINVWGIYILVGGLAVASTFHDPAHLATIPSIVPRSDLVRANSLVLATNQASLAAGFAIGGVLILKVGFQSLAILNLVSFLAGALAVALIAVPRRPTSARSPVKRLSMRDDIFEGLTYLGQHSLARPLVTMEIMEHIPHGLWTAALMLAFTRQALGANAEGWGYQNSAFYGGQLMGAVIAASMAAHMARRPGWIIIWNAFLSSLLTITYALSPNLMVAVVLSLLFGPTSAMRDVAQDSLLQASVDADVMGRIYATRMMFANLSFMLAGAGFAWLADQMPVRWIYLFGGLLYLGTAFYALSRAAIRRSRIGHPAPG